jgi:hypothetical protein
MATESNHVTVHLIVVVNILRKNILNDIHWLQERGRKRHQHIPA